MCKKHYIIETEDKEVHDEHRENEDHEDEDDIQAEILPIYNNGSSGQDYGVLIDVQCNGVLLLCKPGRNREIDKDTCVFK